MPAYSTFPSIDIIDQTLHNKYHTDKSLHHTSDTYNNAVQQYYPSKHNTNTQVQNTIHNINQNLDTLQNIHSIDTQLQTINSSNNTVTVNNNELTTLARSLKDLLHQHTDRQNHVNAMNNQLMAYNFMLHYVQAHKTQKLENEYTVMKQNIDTGAVMLNQLNSELVQQQYQLQQLEHTVSNIELDVEKQQVQYTELSDTLQQQKQTLESAMEDYDSRIAAHEQMLKQQEQSLERLLNVRLRLDFGIDVLIVLIALYLSKIGALPAIIKLIAHITVPGSNSTDIQYRYTRKRKIYAFISVIRILIFAVIVKRLRTLAQQNGLHNNLGNTVKYTNLAKSGFTYLVSNTARLVGGDSAEKHVRQVSNWWLGTTEPSATDNNNNNNNSVQSVEMSTTVQTTQQ